jgi:hypothetical protein
MCDADSAKTGLAQAVERFPEAAVALQLALTSPVFREICEEYALAQQSLAGFEAVSMPPSDPRSATTER